MFFPARSMVSVALVAAFAAGVTPGAAAASPAETSGPSVSAPACDGVTDDSAAFRALIEENAGRSVHLASGCRILVATPGPGGTAFVLPSDTTIRCDDPSAGFVLARRSCSGGPLVGAGCRRDEDCPGADVRCMTDISEGPEFAHRVCGDGQTPCVVDADCPSRSCRPAAEPFTLIRAAPGAENVGVVGCSVDVRQRSQDEARRLLYGTCNGGASDGRPCSQLCSDAPGGASIACNTDEDCRSIRMGSCVDSTLCGESEGGSGDCAASARQAGAPSGPGRIRVIDFSSTRHARVERVWIWDQVYGGFAVALGDLGRLIDSGIGLARSEKPGGLFVGSGMIGRPRYMRRDGHVEVGVASGRQSIISGNEIHAGKIGIRLDRSSMANGNVVTCADQGAWSSRYCSEEADRPHDQRRNCEADDDCAGRCVVDGPDCVGVWVENDQNQIVGNRIYAAFTGIRGAPAAINVTVSANRILYGEGPKIALAGSGWIVSDNYLAWGTKPANGALVEVGRTDAPADGVLSDHLVFTGNLLSGDGGADYEGLAYVRLAEAPSGAHRDLLIANNEFFMKNSHVGIDLSGLDQASASRLSVLGNSFSRGAAAVRFPEGGEGVRGTVFAGNATAVARPLDGWRWEMGDAVGNAPLAVEDDAVQIIYLRNATDSTLEPGTAVAVAAAGGTHGAAPASGGSRLAGVVLATAAAGERVRIASAGTTTCRVETGWLGGIGPGEPLAVGDRGVFVLAPSEGVAVATALAGPEEGRARCLLH